MRRPLALAATTLLLLSACDSAEDEAGPIALEGQDQAPEIEEEADDSATSDAEVDGTDGDADATDEDPAAEGSEDLVDLTEAIPGTWPVGDAGTVTFSIVDGSLVLDEVATADGWSSDVDEQDPDEIEVDFRQGDVEWEIEIELEEGGSTLEIEIDQDIEDADTGSYDIGDAGTFAIDVQEGELELTDLNVNDGWDVVEQDEEPDEIEIGLVNGPRQFDVEIELEDDGTVDVEVDYEVVGPVSD
jgi:hypothetical protein